MDCFGLSSTEFIRESCLSHFTTTSAARLYQTETNIALGCIESPNQRFRRVPDCLTCQTLNRIPIKR